MAMPDLAVMTEAVGWLATTAFATSYIAKSPGNLRRIQAGAALLWIGYGVAKQAPPVIVANAVVAGMALFSLRKKVPE